MGKIAYGRRRTEKKTGTRNETHVVEQSDFPVYEGVHEAIIAEEDWKLAQEKRSKNNYKREKIHDPEHAHILSGILKCPCCGKGMYGNIAKAGRKDNKTRYYYYCKNTVNATGHKCTFRCNIEQTQIDDMLAKLITAMTKEGKFKDAIQDKIGATVDTTDLEKQLSVLNASLHQAETIKTRLEQQMDNLDVTDTHYDKKIVDLQRRLDAQYDRIDEVEETMTELKSQIYELKKNQIDADSIYGFLGAFNEVYSECTDAEKKQFMQAFIERIDIFPERREDGNWIQNIKFQFPVPIIKEGKEVAQIKGISLDKEKSDEHMVSLEKLSTLESIVLLSHKSPDSHIDVKVEFGEGEEKVPLDKIAERAKQYQPAPRVTYKMIQEYIEEKYGFKVHTAYIAEVKRNLGLPMYDAPNMVEELKQPRRHPTAEKVEAIKDALKHFGVI
jgi:hypothetical protein